MSATLSDVLASWNGYYGNHQALSVTIRYVHLAALLVGGGTALALDREIFGLRRSPTVRDAMIARVSAAHALVIGSLVFIVVSGLLMTAADVETYLASPTFWTKMALVAILLVNGAVLARAGHGGAAARGRRLTVASVVSGTLWLVIVYVSNWLRVAA